MFYQFKITLRNLRKNVTYTAINIAGLAIGITASVFIFLWVYHEHSFDKYHPDVDRIYRVINTMNIPGGMNLKGMASPYPLISAVKDFPEIENTAVATMSRIIAVKVNNEIFPVEGKVIHVDEGWFEMFDYKLLEGSFSAFGEHPNSVVLTESEARKYFGNVSAIGQTINIGDIDYEVQAVVKDNPSNSSFQWNIMVSKDAYLANPANRTTSETWLDLSWSIFMKLRKDADIFEITQKINDIYSNDFTFVKMEASLRPLTDIHFETDISGSDFPSGNIKVVSLFSILGILLLLTACINYVNLTTAKANVRTKEVGIRKIVGAKRGALFMQFISESFVVCSIAVLVSLTLIWLLSPFYHLLVENAVLYFSSPVIWIILGTILFTTTLLNGIYPALTLSSFQPVNFLKGFSMLNIKGGNMRRVLVVFQFALSTALLVSVMIIYKQMQYIQKMNPGYNREQVVSLRSPSGAIALSFSGSVASSINLSLQVMKKELQLQAGIVSITLCNRDITNIPSSATRADWDGRAEDFNPPIAFMSVDADYKQTLGLELVEGRWFEEGRIVDETSVILNETAIRELNIREPYIGQRFDILGINGHIIGVVKDFHYQKLHDKIGSFVFINQWYNPITTFKVQAGQSAQAIQAAKNLWINFFPNDPFEYTFLDDSFNNLYKSDIKTSNLMFTFSVLTIVIALLGLFGLVTFAVERRTKEIGIRKVFGARVSNIVILLSKEFLILVGIAMLIAFPLAYYWADRMLQDYVYRINIGWWIFALAGIITILLTLITVGWQAIKAAMENPIKAIKTE